MKIVEQEFRVWDPDPFNHEAGMNKLRLIERAGRISRRSEPENTNSPVRETVKFVRGLIERGHESVLEHASATIWILTNRGVTHELVRHRLCAYTQESTRYCDYSGEIRFIRPVWWNNWSTSGKGAWQCAMEDAENHYKAMRDSGSPPERAREVLPNALATEIVVTANLRQWRHMFRLRCAERAHPQIRSLFRGILGEFDDKVPVVFEDLACEFKGV